MYISFFIIILIILYTLFWIGGSFVTLFQMADDQISQKIAMKRAKIFLIMGMMEVSSIILSIFIL